MTDFKINIKGVSPAQRLEWWIWEYQYQLIKEKLQDQRQKNPTPLLKANTIVTLML